MNCEETRPLVHALIDGEVDAGQAREVEAHLATLASQRMAIDDEQRQRFQPLGDALAVVWQHPAASVELKKRIVRTVLGL